MLIRVKSLPPSAGDIRDVGLIPGLGRSAGGGRGKPTPYSFLENPGAEKPGRSQYVEWLRVRCQ